MRLEAGPDAELVPVRIHPQGDLPLYLQIKHQLSYLITTTRIAGGSRLPTVRALAAQLDVNQHTVGQAYKELQGEGLIESYPGRGTFVRRFADPTVAEATRLERLTSTLRTARRHARNLGFADTAIQQHLGSLVSHEPEVCRVVFVDRYRHIARKYAERLEGYLGDLLEVRPVTVEDLEHDPGALGECHYVFAFARNVPILESIVGPEYEIVTIVSAVVPTTTARLARLDASTRPTLLTEERFVHAALDLLARHSAIDPATVPVFTPSDVAGFVTRARSCDLALYTFGVADLFEPASLGVEAFELVFDVSPESVEKVRAVLG